MRRFISFGIYCLGLGTILGSFKSGCNMNSTNTRICFIDVAPFGQLLDNFWTKFAPVGAPTVNRRFPEPPEKVSKSFHCSEQVRLNMVAIWSTSEKSAKLSYIIGNLD